VKVVTAAKAAAVRTLLTADMLGVKELPVQTVPDGYLTDPNQAAGKMTTTELAPGEILLASRLIDPNVVANNGRMALVMNQDQVLLAFPANDLMNSLGILKAGDHVDLFFSLPVADRTAATQASAGPQSEDLATFDALQNVTIAAVVSGDTNNDQTNPAPGQAKALLLTVSPQDALTLKYLKDAKAVMDVVLRAPGAEQPFETEPVDMDRIINQYRIPAAIGR
jgi:pilus assembly protein CpaB